MPRSSQPAKQQVQLTVNGTARTVAVYPMERLLDVLRQELGLTGAKEGCGEGECGSCSVLLDGQLVNSCLVPIAQANGSKITTIEGLAEDRRLHPLQEAFLACNGAQCGICTPGMLIAARALLDSNPHPTIEEIRESIAGNLCRCTGYTKIIEAIEHAANSTSDRSI